MISSGEDINWVAKMMGDSVETVLRHYHRYLPDKERRDGARFGFFNRHNFHGPRICPSFSIFFLAILSISRSALLLSKALGYGAVPR